MLYIASSELVDFTFRLPSDSRVHKLASNFLRSRSKREDVLEATLIFEVSTEVAVTESGTDAVDDDRRLMGKMGGKCAGKRTFSKFESGYLIALVVSMISLSFRVAWTFPRSLPKLVTVWVLLCLGRTLS